jgi:lipid-A-disaccharide synthase
MKKIFIIAGEASGDLHASNLVKELRLLLPDVQISGWGGGLMQQNGVTILKDYKELAFMGFSEVVKNLGTIFKNFKLCKAQIEAFKPDAILFVDYPGFNLRMAKWAKLEGYKTIYYISPQIWAWKENRIHGIKKYVDQMLVILPFEKAFYEKWDFPVSYVGHPLVSVIEDFKKANIVQEHPLQPTIAVLPGSRKQEILEKLPIMLSVVADFKDYTFIVTKAPGVDTSVYGPLLANYPNVKVVERKTYSVLHTATAAMVTSGTATLETALFGVPQVVCYKGNKLSYLIAKKIVKIKYISLVNLIMDKPVVKELIQDDLNTKNLKVELEKLLNTPTSEKIKTAYNELSSILSVGGNASKKAALLIVEGL